MAEGHCGIACTDDGLEAACVDITTARGGTRSKVQEDDVVMNESVVSTLCHTPLFSHLTHDHLAQVANITRTRELQPNSLLWVRGDPQDALAVLAAGRLKVSVDSEEGREVTLNVLGPGEFLGDMSVIDGSPHSATVTALEFCKVLWIPGPAFRQLTERYPSLVWQLLLAQTARVRALSEEVACMAFLTTCRRIARKVLQLAQDGRVVEISHQDLAGRVGSTRESVTRGLSELERQGLVRTRKQRIEIQDRDRLRQLVED